MGFDYNLSVATDSNGSMSVGSYWEYSKMDNPMVVIQDTSDSWSPDNLKYAFKYAEECGRDYIIIYRSYHEDWPLFHYYRNGTLIELRNRTPYRIYNNYTQKTKEHPRAYQII